MPPGGEQAGFSKPSPIGCSGRQTGIRAVHAAGPACGTKPGTTVPVLGPAFRGASNGVDPPPALGLLTFPDVPCAVQAGGCHARQSLRLLPCLPFQNGQKGQSSPWGKSSPSSCGQPMFPWLSATDLTPYWRKKSFISCWTFGLVVTSVATQRFMIGSAPSCRITPAAIFVVVLSSGPYRATVPRGYCGCWRPAPRSRSFSTPVP